ncbi:Dabb family protein [Howardella ureilytica]|nr:Dabb family protein [Lachnospiraceae bacterium]
MVKHIVMWKLNDDIQSMDKEHILDNMKTHLEDLRNDVEGLLSISVNIYPLDTSTVDVMLTSLLIDEEALKNYANHPKHIEVAEKYVKPFVCSRSCMDYTV